MPKYYKYDKNREHPLEIVFPHVLPVAITAPPEGSVICRPLGEISYRNCALFKLADLVEGE